MLAVRACYAHITSLDNVDDLQTTLDHGWQVQERILARPSHPIQCMGHLQQHVETLVSVCPECPNKKFLMF